MLAISKKEGRSPAVVQKGEKEKEVPPKKKGRRKNNLFLFVFPVFLFLPRERSALRQDWMAKIFANFLNTQKRQNLARHAPALNNNCEISDSGAVHKNAHLVDLENAENCAYSSCLRRRYSR